MHAFITDIITELVKNNSIPKVTMNELEKSIKSINKGKGADINGLTIEHILNAGKDAVIYLLVLINPIFHTGDIPELLKTGILTPAFKRKGSKNKLQRDYNPPSNIQDH